MALCFRFTTSLKILYTFKKSFELMRRKMCRDGWINFRNRSSWLKTHANLWVAVLVLFTVCAVHPALGFHAGGIALFWLMSIRTSGRTSRTEPGQKSWTTWKNSTQRLISAYTDRAERGLEKTYFVALLHQQTGVQNECMLEIASVAVRTNEYFGEILACTVSTKDFCLWRD